MTHYTGFDPYTIGERNEGIRREVDTLRLESSLRKGGSGGPWMAAFAYRAVTLVRTAVLTGVSVSRREAG
jgi:hypothetical protein